MFNSIYYKHMGRYLARLSVSHIVLLSIFIIICTILIGFPIQYSKNF